MLQLLVLLCCCLLAHAQESQSTVTLECQVAGLEYQTAPSCTCVHKLPVCPDGCQVRSRPPGRALWAARHCDGPAPPHAASARGTQRTRHRPCAGISTVQGVRSFCLCVGVCAHCRVDRRVAHTRAICDRCFSSLSHGRVLGVSAPCASVCAQELIDQYYAACQDSEDTNGNGEVEEWNVASAPQVKLLAEQCGCAAAGRPAAVALWLVIAAVARPLFLH